jgi:hypothetical protein
MKTGSCVQAILRLCLSNLSGYNIGITNGKDFMKYIVEMASYGMIYIPGFTKNGAGIQAILRF